MRASIGFAPYLPPLRACGGLGREPVAHRNSSGITRKPPLLDYDEIGRGNDAAQPSSGLMLRTDDSRAARVVL